MPFVSPHILPEDVKQATRLYQQAADRGHVLSTHVIHARVRYTPPR